MANKIVREYARMWPREVFDIKEKNKLLVRSLKELRDLHKGGVYVLYRDDHPYYIGKTEQSLIERLHDHANKSTDKYFNLWNYFSAFVVDRSRINDVEGILISAMPTAANSSSPKIKQFLLPRKLREKLRQARQGLYEKK